MDSATEVRYGGVVVGRSLQVRDRNDAGAFVVFGEPLPVGTAISVKIDDKEQLARVTEVVESADATAAGMRVRFVSAADQKAAAPAPRVAAAAPVVAAPAAAAPVVAAPAPAFAEPPPAAPPPAAAPDAHADSPVPVATEASSASQAVANDSQAHQADSQAHQAGSPAPHHEGEGGRRRRRRK